MIAKRNSLDSYGHLGNSPINNFNTFVNKNVSPLNSKFGGFGRNTDYISDSSCLALTKRYGRINYAYSDFECEYDDLERDKESQA